MQSDERRAGMLFAASCCLLTGVALASDPIDPPPTWGVDDGYSVSLGYDFDSADTLVDPSMSVGFPGWSGASLNISGDYTWQSELDTYTGIVMLGLNGGQFEFTIGNFARPSPWYKEVFIQGIVKGPLGNLHVEADADIVNPTNTVIDLGDGWRLRTITFDLVPQPANETLTWTWPQGEGAFLAAVFVHTHCVPQPAALAPFMILALAGSRRRRQ